MKILEYAIENYQNFDTRRWALLNTGYIKATARLNDELKIVSETRGYNWTCDIVLKKNLPNLMYAKEEDRFKMLTEYIKIRNFLYN